MKNITKKTLIWFIIVLIAWLLFSIWTRSYWLLLGIPIIVDMYITKKVNWSFWKKRGVIKYSAVTEWIDAIIFAVIAASFIKSFFFQMYIIPTSSMEKELLVGDFLLVSKLSYGTRTPITPLSIPFMHHTILGTRKTKSYSEAIQWKYKRLRGYGKVKRNDIFVFNFPVGDTVILGFENPDYYATTRSLARKLKANTKGTKPNSYFISSARRSIFKNYKTRVRPIDKRENYIKRCVAIPGDTLEIKDGYVYINGEKEKGQDNLQFLYRITTQTHQPINYKNIKKLNISKQDYNSYRHSGYLPLTEKAAKAIEALPYVLSVKKQISLKGHYNPNYDDVFPFDARYPWNRDYFGPIVIPRKGNTIQLTPENLPIYERIIGVYEKNRLSLKDSVIYINGKTTDSYTFAMDYYWAMGDSRHNSQDSRFWGFVPENHVVGKASFIWMSKDKDKRFFNWIRWKRLFTSIHK